MKLFKRKTRSDKKQQVGPTVSAGLKREIERLATVTGCSAKFIAEELTAEALLNKALLSELAEHFLEGALSLRNTVYFSHPENEPLPKRIGPPGVRVTARFPEPVWHDVRTVARLLQVTPSRAVSTLLERAMRSEEIVEDLIRLHGPAELTPELRAERKRLLKFVNKKRRPA